MVKVENKGFRRVTPWDISASVTVELFVDVVGAVAGKAAGAFVSGSISSSEGNWKKSFKMIKLGYKRKNSWFTSSVKSRISNRCLNKPALLSASSSMPSVSVKVDPS